MNIVKAVQHRTLLVFNNRLDGVEQYVHVHRDPNERQDIIDIVRAHFFPWLLFIVVY
jgi:hypothetical protein